MITVLAVALAGTAGWLWTSPDGPADRVHRALRAVRMPSAPLPLSSRPAVRGSPAMKQVWAPSSIRGHPAPSSKRRRRPERGETLLCVVVGLTAFLTIGGAAGLVVGVIGFAVALETTRSREPSWLRQERDRLATDLPLAADLMVACLRAGQPIAGAVDATAKAVGGPLGDRLAWVGGQLRLGAAPEDAWQALSSEGPLAPLARTMGRAALSGAPVADILTRLADDARQEACACASAAARRVGVLAVAPLGLCFLPAFVCLGIVPVVAGLAGDVLFP
ncbi:type II secretion system F family protein [Streptosporangium saharense]|uniref:type II secretion system F family protein n=1 Tax=Streptosporangium saharense TaxID=1706840 RepID=UPI003331885E